MVKRTISSMDLHSSTVIEESFLWFFCCRRTTSHSNTTWRTNIRRRMFEDLSIMHRKQHKKYDRRIDRIVDTVWSSNGSSRYFCSLSLSLSETQDTRRLLVTMLGYFLYIKPKIQDMFTLGYKSGRSWPFMPTLGALAWWLYLLLQWSIWGVWSEHASLDPQSVWPTPSSLWL